jgi:hypothetical protein
LDQEVVSAAEVLAGLLPMGCYDAGEWYAEEQEVDTHNNHEHAAAAAAPPPPPAFVAPHKGEFVHTQLAHQPKEDMAVDSRADGTARVQRSRPGSSLGARGISSLKTAAVPAACQDKPLPPQQGGMSPAAAAKGEQARAAAAAGTLNPHVCRAILAALAAGVAADSIDLASTQRKFEVMEQQLHVPDSPAAAHLLSRMNGRSS